MFHRHCLAAVAVAAVLLLVCSAPAATLAAPQEPTYQLPVKGSKLEQNGPAADATNRQEMFEGQASVYDFKLRGADETDIIYGQPEYPLGKVIMIVNTASLCGYTDHHYKQFMKLNKRFAGKGFVIWAFPCDQFGHQEPGDHREVAVWAKKHYNFQGTMFAKCSVNPEAGRQPEHPLYAMLKKITDSGDIEWNFTKFLVWDQGTKARRFSHDVQPEEMAEEIQNLLSHPGSRHFEPKPHNEL
jgi:glutathione peroxidase